MPQKFCACFPLIPSPATVPREPFKRRSDLDHLMDGLRLAGLPD
jgi:hypothetical protein